MNTKFDIGEKVLLEGTIVGLNINSLKSQETKSTNDVSIAYNVEITDAYDQPVFVMMVEDLICHKKSKPIINKNILKDISDEDLIGEINRRGLISENYDTDDKAPFVFVGDNPFISIDNMIHNCPNCDYKDECLARYILYEYIPKLQCKLIKNHNIIRK